MHLLARLSLRNRALIVLVCLFVAVFGVLSMTKLKQELIPSVEFPQITVMASNPGASPEVMDEQVGRPLESALQAAEGLDSSTSTSSTGTTVINLTFAYGTDLDRARSQVDRALSNAQNALPDGVQPSSFAGSVADLPVLYYAVKGSGSLAETQDALQADVVPALQKLDGVRQVDVSGAASRYVSILPKDSAMKDHGLTEADLQQAVQGAGRAASLGTLADGTLTLPVQTDGAPGSVKDVQELRVTPAAGAGALDAQGAPTASGSVRLGDVADVKVADGVSTSITRTNGEPTLALSVTKTPDADTVRVSQAVRDAIGPLAKASGTEFTLVFDQAPSITDSIHDLTVEGLLGLAFAVVVILLFLLSLRSTLVTAVSIPLSLLVTFIGIWAFGFSLNMLTLGALTISIGRVVDDSIVVIENINRHQRYGEPRGRAIFTAVREVAGAITASTLTTVAVFLPVAFVSGLAGELFRPFALTVTIALLASLFVALTIVPVLAYWFLRARSSRKATAAAGAAPAGAGAAPAGAGDGVVGHSVPDDAGPVPVSLAGAGSAAAADRAAAEEKEEHSWLQRGYVPVLRGTQRHPVVTLVVSVLILIATLGMTPLLKTNLLGGTGQQAFSASLELPAGTSLATTDKAAGTVSDALRDLDGVQDVQYTVGSAGGLAGAFGGGGSADSASFTVTADPSRDIEAVVDSARAAVKDLKTGGEVTVSSADSGGFSSDITVDIRATTPKALKAANDAVVKAMQGIDQATAVESNLSATSPQVRVTVDRSKAADAGLSQAQITQLVNGTINPLDAGSLTFGFDTLAVKVGSGRSIDGLSALNSTELTTPLGKTVKLSDVATIKRVDVEESITTQNTDRIATVSITPTEDGLGAVGAEVQKRLDGLTLADGATATVGGAATQQAESFSQLGLAMLAAIAIVYVIMVATFKSLVQPLILLVSIPFAATGAIGLLLVSGVPLGLASLIGMLMLVGIVVTNAIVLIDLINQYRNQAEGRAAMSLEDAITHGARRRLRPILMTALATIFAMTPMALGVTGSGGFISQPLAVVVIGGLISSTLLTLVLVPVLYRLVEGRREKRRLAGKGPGPDGLDDASLGLGAAGSPGAGAGGGAGPAVPDAAGVPWTGTIDLVTGLPRPSRGRHAASPKTDDNGTVLPH